jgi:dTDP-4-amino-4,6-dideoxygalactose transaminase
VLFRSFEGGAAITKEQNLKKEIDSLKNFGFTDEITVAAPGINAKMNEFQAAIGLLELDIVNQEIAARKMIAKFYRNKLCDVKGIGLFMDMPDVEHNYSFFPILIDFDVYGLSRDQVYNKLKEHNVFSRRYFYPLISNFAPYYNLPSSSKENLPVANRIAEQVLCLPIYGALELSQVDLICQLIAGFSK